MSGYLSVLNMVTVLQAANFYGVSEYGEDASCRFSENMSTIGLKYSSSFSQRQPLVGLLECTFARVYVCISTSSPTGPFKILEPENQEIGEF